MSTFKQNIDFRGARGSNTGDQFHELWALQQVLDLLHPGTDLMAVSVEGVRAETPPSSSDDSTLEGVDCALYFGGEALETVDRVEFIQLKYSAANPEQVWSVPRLVKKTAKRKNNSIIHKMADDFRGAKARIKQDAELKIRLVSNQNISARLKRALKARWSGPFESSNLNQATRADLKRLIDATGLNVTEFKDFLETLDFDECGSQSRFAVKERVVATVADLLGDDVLSEVRELQMDVRKLMLPESTGMIVTNKIILSWFGLSSREGLFPCPSDFQLPEINVERSAAYDVIKLLLGGERLVLVHGEGGCGKTTLVHQVADLLPEESVTIFFDCFGGGRYIYSDDKRHLPENAFLQISNELAGATRLPLFIPRSNKNPANIKIFMAKLNSAGEALKQLSSEKILLIVIDAADNSVVAANVADPPERTFLFDLFNANLSDLPENVHIVISCRSSRIASLRLPPNTPEAICPLFTSQETKQYLETEFPNPSESLVEQFHHFSNENPRVQAYAIARAKGDPERLLEALLPVGRSLPDVLEASFKTALRKLGQPLIFEKLVGGLAFLPAPINVPSLARIAGCSDDIVKDLSHDLGPGLRLQGNTVTVADEDFETFIKEKAATNPKAIIKAIADDFFATFQADSYSSIHVADLLIAADRAGDLWPVIEQDPQVVAIGDPIVRRQVQVRRLKLSLAACREAGSTTDALKSVLISAEAERDDSLIKEILEKELDLSVEFAGSSLRRTILMDRDRVEKHGSFLAQDAVRAIRTGDHLTAREQLRFHNAWLKRREELEKHWAVTDNDVSARVESILELAGPKVALRELMNWKPRDISLRVAFILVPQLIAAGKINHIKTLLQEDPPNKPWDLLLWVPLAMAGEPVNGLAIQESLEQIQRRFIPDIVAFRMTYGEDKWKEKLLDTFITACELAFKLGLDSQAILTPIDRILEALEGKQKRRLYSSDVYRFDGLLRCWLLREAISAREAKEENFIEYIKTLNPEPEAEKRIGGKRPKKNTRIQQKDDQEVNQLNKKILTLFPIYSARVEIISCAGKNLQITDEQLGKLDEAALLSYDFDYAHDSIYLREMVAQSVMGLLIVENIEASELVQRASKLAQGRFNDLFAGRRQKLWARMRLRTSESDKLVLMIAKASEEIKEMRAASSEKFEAIIRLSRLILPVSRDDAESLFNDAIEIAKEIDREAVDQIDFVSVLAEKSQIIDQSDRRTIADNFIAFVSSAAERLSDHDGFPWRSAVRALTCVDYVAALAAICRWADTGTVALYETLGQFLQTALQRGIIDPQISTSLALLIGGSDRDLRKEILSRSVADIQKYKGVIEELAKETLLLFPQHERLPLGKEIVDQTSPENCPEGPWFAHLRDTIAFLRNSSENEPDKAMTDHLDKVSLFTNDNDLPMIFDFDHRGRSFTTPESIAEVLRAAKDSGLPYDDYDLLRKMRDVSSNPRDKIPFLEALSNVPKDSIYYIARLEMIRETIALWKGFPAVDRWCEESLPSVLVMYFYAATRFLKEGQSVLNQLLDYTGVDVKVRLQIILEGVAQVGEALNSRNLFAIAEEIARTIDADEAGEILLWYAQHLRSRLPAENQYLGPSADIPNDMTEAIARLLFSLMSDIDMRVRWRAAHSLRLLAKLGCFDVVKTTVSQSNRIKDDTFRDPTAPFYFLAAKLWLTISLYRISAETPEALSSCKSDIFNIATSSELPHVGIREYAKRTLIQLITAGAISLNSAERAQIDEVNTALKGQTPRKRDNYWSFGCAEEYGQRFRFDEMDTIRYWYEPILQIFPTVSQELFLQIAERWILDEWGAGPEANRWDREPRRARYDERRYIKWMHSHGSLPTVERYGTHLEWNAMHCVVGELLTTQPISNEVDDSYYSFYYWLGRILPTEAPKWLSDNRGPTPLESRLWIEDPRTDNGWLHNIRRDEFLAEVGIYTSLRKGWIVVKGNYTTHFGKREANIQVNSALVSPETAPALVRALQTASNPYHFRIPDEEDDQQIDSQPFRLLGWLEYIEADKRFDAKDPFRHEVDQIRAKPGRELTAAFGLKEQAGIQHTWIGDDTADNLLIFEAWSDKPPPDRGYYPESIYSEGWRLWARSDMVRSFIAKSGWDLIFEVHVNRWLRNEYGRLYEADEKSKTHEKILLLRADGSVEDTKGRIGSWASVSRGTGA